MSAQQIRDLEECRHMGGMGLVGPDSSHRIAVIKTVICTEVVHVSSIQCSMIASIDVSIYFSLFAFQFNE